MSEQQQQQQNNGEQQQQSTPWYGDAHKDYVTSKGWKTADDVIASSQNLEKLLGADKAGRTVVLPKDDTDVDGLKAFRAKLGVPEKADGYAVPEKYRDTLKDDKLLPAVAAAAHKHGIPAKAYEGFLGDVLEAATGLGKAADDEANAAATAALDALKAKHGDQFDAKLELSRRLIGQVFTGEDGKALEGDALTAKVDALMRGEFTAADAMQMFISLGEKLGEPGAGGGQNMGGHGRMTQQDAAARLDELRAKRIENKITEKDFEAEMARLGPIAYPGTRAA
jgi:hypothetical protein